MSQLKGETHTKDFISDRRTTLRQSFDEVRPLFLVLRQSYLPLFSTNIKGYTEV